MDAFVTGGSGFIGKRLVALLVERGWQVRALARSEKAAQTLNNLGAAIIPGSLYDKETLEKGMRDCQVVFHVAGWYRLGARDKTAGEKVNVQGTRCVLETAFELGIPRIVNTSSIAIFGDTHGQVVDETYRMPPDQPFVTEYDRSKYRAHYEVARPLIEAGAPIINVLPGAVYGPADTSLFGQLMQYYYHGLFPIFPGTDTVPTFVHVDDSAYSLLLAAEKGRPGEDYIMSGPAVSLGEMVKLWSELSGRRPPLAYIPARVLRPLAPLAARLPLPEILSADAIRVLGVSYAASSAKAHRELGWAPRPIEEGMAQTMEWIRKSTTSPLPLPELNLGSRKRGVGLALIGLGLILALRQRRNRRR